jgi:AraC-like DNA-binding protein/mannose-6-phosphate isomerase-like protein (cupin superfamily)
MELEEYAQYRENKVHARPGFAYNTYLCTIPQDFERVNTHWHDEMEIIYIKKGAGTVTVDLRRYPVAAGAIVLVRPGQLHAIEGRRGIRMEYENILFSLSLLDTPQSDWCRENCLAPLAAGQLPVPTCLVPGRGAHDAAAAALDAADHACAEARPGYPLRVKSELFRLLDALYTDAARAGEAPAPRPAPGAARLKGVLAWAAAHLEEPITVADAAKQACYSPAHFMRFFKSGTGQSFVEYLTELRLTAAARDLAETEAPVAEIARRCGFDSAAYFCRRFKARYGVSPRAWRRGAAEAHPAAAGERRP